MVILINIDFIFLYIISTCLIVIQKLSHCSATSSLFLICVHLMYISHLRSTLPSCITFFCFSSVEYYVRLYQSIYFLLSVTYVFVACFSEAFVINNHNYSINLHYIKHSYVCCINYRGNAL